MRLSNIKEESDTCVISFNKKACLHKIVGEIIVYILLLCMYVWCVDYKSFHWSLYIWIIIGSVCFFIILSLDIRNLHHLPRPLILTHEELELPDGLKLKWKDIDSIYFNPIRGTMPELCIKTKQNSHVEKLLDWYLYANKNELIRLFEKYANKKLYQ